MKMESFKIEDWMNLYCPSAKYDLTTTCIEPLSLRDLLILCDITNASEIMQDKLTYGDIHGSVRLKTAIGKLYSKQELSNITVTHGAIGANELVFKTLINHGDEVVVLAPIYQQHYAIPKSLGASIKFVFLREENNWLPNLAELEKKLAGKTKLLCLNNPNNPTGSVIPDEMLEEIVAMAQKYNVWILSDEVYRGLNFFGNKYSKSIADMYDKGISVGSMSKTYSLPGLRVGWICARSDLITQINGHREYNTISISILDDYFSAIALENRHKIEKRNFVILQNGYNILNEWLNSEVYIKANLPQGGTTALLRYKKDIPSRVFCKELQKKTGVALLPGETMEMEGTVRVGFCTNPEVLTKGLHRVSKFLRTL